MKKKNFTIRIYFVTLILCVLVAVSFTTWFAGYLFLKFTDKPFAIPSYVSIAVISVVLGITVTVSTSKKILSPVSKLDDAMKRVSEGDYSVRLETSSNIEEIKSSYQSFNIMTKALNSTEIIQTDFVSNVSHEFKTPINAIEGYAMLLQESKVSAEESEYIDKILLNTRRVTELISGILLLSKIENQVIAPKKEIFRLDEQIRKAIVSLELKWTSKDIEFDVNLDEMNYFGNEALLFHVWYNLIGNAIKFSPTGGTIEINMTAVGDGAEFSVRDYGEGISEDAQKHIFDKFYQADNSHAKEGNGLGLALVIRIIKINGGNIRVENAEGGGAKFTVTLVGHNLQEVDFK